MLAYYGYTISPNQMETVEGFLICRNVPIARTGDMDYLESELKPDGDGSKTVAVHRSPEEVFSEAALSSFEGKPVTDEHPPDLLSPDTCSQYARGHAQNVRKGEGEWDGCVMADLHIQDEELIRAVQGGKREISCGYECDYVDDGDGTYSQRDIRGNHVAVVSRGRAGRNVAILDSIKPKAERPERNEEMKKSSLFLKLFARAAKDASPEELESLAADTAAAMDEEPKGAAPVGPPQEAEGDPAKEAAGDSAGLDAKLDKILDMLSKREDAPPAQEGGPLDELVGQLTGEDGIPDESGKEGAAGGAKVIPAEEAGEPSSAADRAVMAAVIKRLRPVVAGIKDAAARKEVTDSLVGCLTDKDAVSDIAKIARATRRNAALFDGGKPQIDMEAYQSAYDALNPHKIGGK